MVVYKTSDGNFLCSECSDSNYISELADGWLLLWGEIKSIDLSEIEDAFYCVGCNIEIKEENSNGHQRN